MTVPTRCARGCCQSESGCDRTGLTARPAFRIPSARYIDESPSRHWLIASACNCGSTHSPPEPDSCCPSRQIVFVAHKPRLDRRMLLPHAQAVRVVRIRRDVAAMMLDLHQPVFSVPGVRRDMPRRLLNGERVSVLVTGGTGAPPVDRVPQQHPQPICQKKPAATRLRRRRISEEKFNGMDCVSLVSR
jgi:hypothetical protein